MNGYLSQKIFPTTQLEEAEGDGCNVSGNATMGEIIGKRFSRRNFLQGSLAVSAIAATVSPIALMSADEARAAGQAGSAFSFTEVEAGVDAHHHVAEGYSADILLRWGDAVLPGAPAFDPTRQSAEAQSKQFGYNNDYVGFIPLDGAPDHGLLVVNHEYTNPHLMFPGLVEVVDGKIKQGALTKEQVDIEMAAHGGTIVEIRKIDGKWQVISDGRYNRRITANTPMEITGPAAGHERLKTSADPSATRAVGTINNCAGGVTPWGTYIMAEETSMVISRGKCLKGIPKPPTISAMEFRKALTNGASSTTASIFPKSRTSPTASDGLSRSMSWIRPRPRKSAPRSGASSNEGAESIIAKNGKVVFYLGDDERFDYVYKFVTEGVSNPADRAANMNLLDKGTLHVAKFNEDGTMKWLPLVHGQGPLTAENGFASQADVVIEARRAGDLLGATKMDRPEDVQPNSVNGKVYVMLTNNTRRKADQVDAANPRAENAFGHIIEISEDDGDFSATSGKWEVLLKCGDPSVAAVGATFSTETTKNGWFGMPDNCAVDSSGRLWVATDGNSNKGTGRTDGLWGSIPKAMRATSKLFFRVPVGAEMCGPLFAPDDETAFVAVQHPGDGGEDWEGHSRPSYYEDLSTRWPDFKPDMPVRPAVVAITKIGGAKIAV